MEPQNYNQPTNMQQMASPLMPPTEPEKKRFPRKLLILFLIADIIIVGAVIWWFVVRDSGQDTNQPAANNQSQSVTEPEDETEPERIVTTHVSGLEHRSTASFEHPKDWTVIEETDAIFETYTIKSTTIVAPKGLRIKITDKDGIGGGCYPESQTYTLVKKLTTQTPGMSFKQFTVAGNSEDSHPFFVLDTDGTVASMSASYALKEGESITGECAVNTFPSVGRAGVFVDVMTGSTDRTVQTWDLIKDDAEFVRTLQSMKAEDKSGN